MWLRKLDKCLDLIPKFRRIELQTDEEKGQGQSQGLWLEQIGCVLISFTEMKIMRRNRIAKRIRVLSF